MSGLTRKKFVSVAAVVHAIFFTHHDALITSEKLSANAVLPVCRLMFAQCLLQSGKYDTESLASLSKSIPQFGCYSLWLVVGPRQDGPRPPYL